jgi:hypothetical protein
MGKVKLPILSITEFERTLEDTDLPAAHKMNGEI